MMRLLLIAGFVASVTTLASVTQVQEAAASPEDAAAWRAEGPEGFSRLHASMADTIQRYHFAKHMGAQDPLDALGLETLEPRIRMLDQVAMQRDAYASGLYWFTDLDAAIAEARRTGRPILSLRMLGNLDEEYSCANSRYFRTVLYADEALGQTLRDGFVLHWQSVRPVPVITVDMGDGRQIKRTITGNSAHYVLDSEGRVVDVLPGLYGARAFERLLADAAELANETVGMESTRRDDALASWHRTRAEQLDEQWAQLSGVPVSTGIAGVSGGDVIPGAREAATVAVSKSFEAAPLVEEVVGMPDRGKLLLSGKAIVEEVLVEQVVMVAPGESGRSDVGVANNPGEADFPNAIEAGRLALGGKRRVEEVMVRQVVPVTPIDADRALWDRVAATYAEDSRLDRGSRRLMREKAVPAEQAARRATSKAIVEDPMVRMVRNFESSVALDTARNEHLLHRQIHDWFVTGQIADTDLDTLNSRVYAELFLTPDEDPWLGLVPADTYSAIEAGGLSETVRTANRE